GACIGHVGPEALEGGPIGKLRDGDLIRIEIDTRNLTGRLDFIGEAGHEWSPDAASEVLKSRELHPGLQPDPQLPDDTRLWAMLQRVSGGTWAGCVYDVDAIVRTLQAGLDVERAAELTGVDL
ncbi:MAG TPA: dihydroxy-acid dehydratase, partial [Planctomycetaceae bacterium]|nr:dihydroxy-acid dehydratase [Planctomycetaceae bacterium]